MVRNVVPERTRRLIGLLSVVVALALPACGAASAGPRPHGSHPAKSGDAGAAGCIDAAASVRHVANALGEGRPIATVPAIRKAAAPVEASDVASVPAFGAGRPAAVRATAKTAFGGMRAVGTAPAGAAGICN